MSARLRVWGWFLLVGVTAVGCARVRVRRDVLETIAAEAAANFAAGASSHPHK